MPIYEYRCDPCGDFEVLRSLKDYNAPMYCPECENAAIKIVSLPNVNLNSGSLSALASSSCPEPKLVKKKATEPAKLRHQQVNRNRPWMISHAPARY